LFTSWYIRELKGFFPLTCSLIAVVTVAAAKEKIVGEKQNLSRTPASMAKSIYLPVKLAKLLVYCFVKYINLLLALLTNKIGKRAIKE